MTPLPPGRPGAYGGEQGERYGEAAPGPHAYGTEPGADPYGGASPYGTEAYPHGGQAADPYGAGGGYPQAPGPAQTQAPQQHQHQHSQPPQARGGRPQALQAAVDALVDPLNDPLPGPPGPAPTGRRRAAAPHANGHIPGPGPGPGPAPAGPVPGPRHGAPHAGGELDESSPWFRPHRAPTAPGGPGMDVPQAAAPAPPAAPGHAGGAHAGPGAVDPYYDAGQGYADPSWTPGAGPEQADTPLTSTAALPVLDEEALAGAPAPGPGGHAQPPGHAGYDDDHQGPDDYRGPDDEDGHADEDADEKDGTATVGLRTLDGEALEGRAARRRAAQRRGRGQRARTQEAGPRPVPGTRLEARRAARAARPGPALIASRFLGEAFISIGVLMLLFVVYQLWWTNVRADEQAGGAAQNLQDQWKGAGDPDRQAGTFAPGQGFAIIYIPKLDIKTPIAQGVGKSDVLDKGMVGHYNGSPFDTAMPWDKQGNFALAGHRNTHGEPFRYVNRLVAGDKIVVETQSTFYTYEMTNRLASTSPSNTDVIRPVPQQSGFTGPGRYITLTTCTPEFTSKYRLIVWGKMVEERPRSKGKPDALVGG